MNNRRHLYVMLKWCGICWKK